jgi:hypothetical protein
MKVKELIGSSLLDFVLFVESLLIKLCVMDAKVTRRKLSWRLWRV